MQSFGMAFSNSVLTRYPLTKPLEYSSWPFLLRAVLHLQLVGKWPRMIDALPLLAIRDDALQRRASKPLCGGELFDEKVTIALTTFLLFTTCNFASQSRMPFSSFTYPQG